MSQPSLSGPQGRIGVPKAPKEGIYKWNRVSPWLWQRELYLKYRVCQEESLVKGHMFRLGGGCYGKQGDENITAWRGNNFSFHWSEVKYCSNQTRPPTRWQNPPPSKGCLLCPRRRDASLFCKERISAHRGFCVFEWHVFQGLLGHSLLLVEELWILPQKREIRGFLFVGQTTLLVFRVWEVSQDAGLAARNPTGSRLAQKRQHAASSPTPEPGWPCLLEGSPPYPEAAGSSQGGWVWWHIPVSLREAGIWVGTWVGVSSESLLKSIPAVPGVGPPMREGRLCLNPKSGRIF